MSTTPTPAAEVPAAEAKPQTLLEKVATAIPIGLAALATVFAGMSSGELQKAMFWRTAAGQDQARATNQWTFAGLKRNRSLIMEGTAASLLAGPANMQVDFAALATRAEAKSKTLTEKALKEGKAAPKHDWKVAVDWLNGKGPPTRVKLPDFKSEAIPNLTRAIFARKSEEETLKLAALVSLDQINEAINTAAEFRQKTEDEWDIPVKTAGLIIQEAKGEEKAAAKAAWFEMEQRRYRGESGMELQLGSLYDARVRVVTAQSDRHRQRSQNFFYAMLAGQIGAVVATLAMSRKTSTVLWLLAALLGASAIGFGGFVHLAF